MSAKTRSFCRATLAVAFGTLVLCLSFDAAMAACHITPFKFKFGAQSSTSMAADSGQPCNIKLREGSGTIIKSLVTVSRPARGSVTPQNSVNIAYRSRPGFQGQDRFVFKIVGTKNGIRGAATVVVGVSVGNGGGGSFAQVAGNVSRSAGAKGAGRRSPIPDSLRMTCLRQAGASIDPVTKRWTFYFTERDGASRTDMFRLCLAGGDREKAKTIVVPERTRNPGNG